MSDNETPDVEPDEADAPQPAPPPEGDPYPVIVVGPDNELASKKKHEGLPVVVHHSGPSDGYYEAMHDPQNGECSW
jgi:hypothetical protein